MKYSKLKVAIISTFAFFAIVFGGSYIYLSNKLTPELINSETRKILEKTFPNADVKLGQIKLSLGLSAKFKLEKLDISYKNKKMIFVENADLFVPFWTIFQGGGIVDLRLDNPIIGYYKIKDKDNWSLAMGSKKKEKTKKASTKKKASSTTSVSDANKLALPAFALNSKLNIKLKNSIVNYDLAVENKGQIVVNKFVLKELSLSAPTALELDSRFILNKGLPNEIDLDVLTIGEFNLANLVAEKDLDGVFETKIKKIKIKTLPYNIPDVKLSLLVKLDKLGSLKGQSKLEFLNSSLKLDFLVAKKTIIDKLKIKIPLKDLVDILGEGVKDVDFGQSALEANGKVTISKSGKKSINLKASIGPNIDVSLPDLNEKLKNSAKFELLGERLVIQTTSKLLSGTILSDTSMNIDINNFKGKDDIKNIVSKIKMNNITIPGKMIKGKMYTKKKESKGLEKTKRKGQSSTTTTSSGSGKSRGKLSKNAANDVELINARVSLNLNDVFISGSKYNGDLKAKISKKKIRLNNSKIHIDKGLVQLNALTELGKGQQNTGDFNILLKNVDLASFKVFFPDVVENVYGKFSGSVNGNFKTAPNKTPEYKADVNVLGVNGKLENFKLAKAVNEKIGNVDFLKKKMKGKKIKFDPDFEKLTFKGVVTDKKYSLGSFEFHGVRKKVWFKGSGTIYPIKGNSQVQMKLIERHSGFSKILKETVGTETLPLRLKGEAMNMKMDHEYTVKKLGKKYVKSKGKKKIKKEVKKLLESKKIKKIFKGLF